LSLENRIIDIQKCENYPDPKDYNEHTALGDARWGFDFYKFLLRFKKNK
jgi:hypothetical protein